MEDKALFLLLGYHNGIDKCGSRNTPYVLLYKEEDQEFSIGTLKPTDCFRTSFVDKKPPSRYSYVIYDEKTRMVLPQNDLLQPYRDVNLIPDFLFKDTMLDNIFNALPPLAQSMRMNLNDRTLNPLEMWENKTLLGFLNKTLTHSFVHDLTTRLIQEMSLRPCRICVSIPYIPTRLQTLFVKFEPIQWTSSYEDKGADYVFLRQAIVKYVLEQACPFITVALEDTCDIEKCLALTLPHGSKNKGVELYISPPEEERYSFLSVQYSKHKEPIFFSSFSGKMVTKEIPPMSTIEIIPPLEDPENFLPIDGTQKKFSNIKEWYAFIAYFYENGCTDLYFKNGAVIFSHLPTPETPFLIHDFSNFYPSIARIAQIDPYIGDVLEELAQLCTPITKKFLKPWMVTIIGKSKYYDPKFFNLIKQISVAIMVYTISKNPPGSILGTTTDGLLVDINVDKVVYPTNFEIKCEFKPHPSCKTRLKDCNHYAGINEAGVVIHRGCIGRDSKTPLWYKDLISMLIRSAFLIQQDEDTKDQIMREHSQQLTQYFASLSLLDVVCLPSQVVSSILPTKIEYPLIYWITNDSLLHRGHIYTKVTEFLNMYIISPPENSDVKLGIPNTISGFCALNIDISKYQTLLEEKIVRVSALFLDDERVKNLCSLTRNITTDFMHKIIPSGDAIYPGGMVEI